MSQKIKFSLLGAIVLFSWLLLMGSAFGYVRVEQVTTIVEPNGEQTEINSLILLEGDKKRIDSAFRTIGETATPSSFSGTRHVTIIRLDKELIWKVNRIDRTHTEQTFTDLKEKMEDWEPGVIRDVQVEAGGEKKQINGYSVEPYLLTLRVGQNGDNPQDLDGFTIVSQVWVTQNISKAINKLQDFGKRFDAKVGIWGDMETGEMSFIKKDDALLEKGLLELQKAVKALKGYPIRIETKVLGHSAPPLEVGAKQTASPLPRIHITTEVKGIYTSVVFCTCTDKKKLFELLGGFINLQAP